MTARQPEQPGEEFHGFRPLPPRGGPVSNAMIDLLREDELVSRARLDINVLLTLLDSDHVDHDRARVWLDGEIATGWASCAITQNGFVAGFTFIAWLGGPAAAHTSPLCADVRTPCHPMAAARRSSAPPR